MTRPSDMTRPPTVRGATRARRAAALSLLALAPSVGSVSAQSDLALEFGGSQIGPPVGVQGENARFLMAGLRGSHYALGGSGAYASVLFGQTLSSTTGGSFLSGMLGGTLSSQWTSALTGSFEARVLGYGTQRPFPYRAFAAEGGPSLRGRTPKVGVKVSGIGGVGVSQLKLWRVDGGPTRLFENDLWRVGGVGELTLGPVTSNLGLVGGWHHTPAGDYVNTGARFVIAGGWGLAEFRIDRWDTPDAVQTTGGLSLILPVGRSWSLRGFFGRTEPDPLTLAQPGSGGGGMLIGRSLLPEPEESAFSGGGPWEIVEYGDAASRVRLSITAPEGSTAVQLLGDFTLWEPVPMARSGSTWVVEIDVPVGTHHFGFLVDDEWYVPDDAKDVIADEWGRENATLVIEGAPR